MSDLFSTNQSEIFVSVGDYMINGWETAQIVASIDRIPRTFSLQVITDIDSILNGVYGTTAQMPCKIQLYTNSSEFNVVNGYVEIIEDNISATNHQITYAGRGACCDLVDCSASFYGQSLNALQSISVYDAIAKIAQVYDINVWTDKKLLKN